MKFVVSFIAVSLVPFISMAGGNPEFVHFPTNYKVEYTHYHTQNRANNKQVADFYANSKAVESINRGELIDGSIIVMEVYKPEIDKDGNPVKGEDGVFIKSNLAAVAVMEKNRAWDAKFPQEDRTGDWGYAIYSPSGDTKENNLECASCHMPLKNNDYMFTYQYLGK